MYGCIHNLDISNLSDVMSAVIALIALIVAICKYNESVNRNKAKTLSMFNQRFTNESTLVNVTKVLTNNSDGFPNLTLYDIETYCRFGEELEIAIRDGYLNANDVRNMFWFYIDKAKEQLSDYDNENWPLLRSLSERMNSINK